MVEIVIKCMPDYLAYIWLQMGRYTGKLTRDEKTDLPNVNGEVKCAINTTFAHLWRETNVYFCPRFQASLQAIKAVFVTPLTLTFDAPQKYIWLASSNTYEIRAKGVAKSAAKFCLRLLKVKGLPKVWSNGVRLKLRSKLQKFNKGAAKYVCFFPPLASRFSPVSPFAWIPRSPRASSECGVIASLGS